MISSRQRIKPSSIDTLKQADLLASTVAAEVWVLVAVVLIVSTLNMLKVSKFGTVLLRLTTYPDAVGMTI